MNRQNQGKKLFFIDSQSLRKLIVFLVFCLVSGFFVVSCTDSVEVKQPPTDSFKPLEPEQKIEDMSNVDFTTFKHNEGRHAGVPCLVCHEQNEKSPQPKFMGHQSCAGCHVEQFKDKNHAICATCHTNAESGDVKEFPPIKSFGVKFDHSAHLNETNCATCHQTQGVNMTIPSGANAHSNCFQCHTAEKIVGEKNIGSCATCHEAGKADQVSASVTKVGYNFSHSRHGSLNCQSCHNSAGGNNMTAITTGMHSGANNNCATCHNGQKAFGANNFSDCRQCHQEVANTSSFGVKFDHAQHNKQNCATCHKAGGKGVNFSVPNGQAAHNTCFQCHSPMKGSGEFTSGKCFTCHQIGGRNDITPSKQTIAGNFNHTKHSGLDCDSCHTTSKGMMSAPTVAMHKQIKSGFSCASCHNNEMAFGENFANCKQCHTNRNFNK